MPRGEVTHEGRRTAFRYRPDDGSGNGVVCVHGPGATHAVWRSQFGLADERPIAALDLSGHGTSDSVDADPGWETISAYASDVLAVVEETDASYLLGHSIGAAVALHLATQRECELAGIAVVGIGPRLLVHEEVLRLAETNFDELVSFLHQPARLFHEPDPELLELSRAAMYECGQAVTLRDYRTAHTLDLRPYLRQLEIPVLALCGVYDRITPIEVHQRFVSALSMASLQVIPDAAHAPMLESPKRVNHALSGFFTEHEDE